jgi:hypothetical protein
MKPNDIDIPYFGTFPPLLSKIPVLKKMQQNYIARADESAPIFRKRDNKAVHAAQIWYLEPRRVQLGVVVVSPTTLLRESRITVPGLPRKGL